MRKRRSYRRVAVKDVCMDSLVDRACELGDANTCVGLDIAKREIVAVCRWENGDFERPLSVANPDEIEELIEVLNHLQKTCDGLRIGMESTGTYGEAIRRALTLAGFTVHRVSGKAVSDYREIFDGVPSQHDGKDAAMIAELTAHGKGTPWPFREASEEEQQIARFVHRMDAYQKQMRTWLGRLEGLLARHWPQLTNFLPLGSPTLLRLIATYGSADNMLADAGAQAQLVSWSRSKLSETKIENLLDSARCNPGVPPCEAERSWMCEVASEALSAYEQVKACAKQLKELTCKNDAIQALSGLGNNTMCVLWTKAGDPRNYGSAGAYVKALGLNLKELSSGKRLGELAITKRGPSLARRWLYFAALRAIQRSEVKRWYEAKTSRDQQHGKMKGLIAVMRKLARAIWHVLHTGEAFDWAKLFPGQPI